MRYAELRKWLKEQGCTFEPQKGGSGHITCVSVAESLSCLLTARAGIWVGAWVEKIKKDLGLK